MFLVLILMAIIWCMPCATQADYPLASHKYAADPAGMEFNGRLYLYCSNDTDNTTNSYQMHSISCYSTDDLKNWTDHGEVLQVPRDVSWATLSWVPSAVSNNGVAYLYFANGAGTIGVTTNANPTGSFKDAKGSALINSSTPGASTSTQWLFDPCGFVDSDGQAYLYFGGQYPTNARVILLNTNLISVSGSATPMFATNFFEASYLHKRNGTYYYTYCNRFEFGAAIYCETNSNPTNGFAPQGTVLANPPQNVNNNNHHSIVSFGTNWYVVYHNRTVALQNGLSNSAAVYKRSLCLDAVNYNADGSIIQVTPTTNGLPQLKNLNPYVRVEAETIASQSGIATEACVEGGMDVTNIFNGNWIMLRGVDFTVAGATNFTARIASAGSGGNVELRLDATNGTLIGNCAVPFTGGWQTWAGVSTTVSNATARGVHNLYLKFIGAAATNLFNLNWWQFASSTNSSSPISLLKFEAESGVLGSDWAVSNSISPAYITITTDGAGGTPSNAARVATYTVTFPTPGTYQLYARVRVGSGAANDDSLFFGNGFGVKNPTNSADWILANNIANSRGFINPADVVTGGGTAGNGVWKWINLSLLAPGAMFAVTTTNLTQTFQIGARENGLDMDAFAFGLSYYTYTVSDLDSGIDGTPPSAGSSVINWTSLLQRMDGFGGGAVFLDVPDPIASTNMDTLYNTNSTNLGLTLLRVRISPDTNWSAALTDAQRAIARGGRVLATPWTPPASMKTTNSLVGGAVATNQYATFASYLNNFAGYLKSNGAPLAAVSIQNEPDFLATYESCLWNSGQFLAFFRTNAAAITNAPVMMPESFHFDQTLSDATLNDAVAVTNVACVGGHLYDATIADYPLAHSKGKPTWMTEWLVNDQTIDSAISTAQQIHDCINIGNMSAYIWWKVMGNANGLLNAAGVAQKRGFVMAQFSRFVRPGFNRIAASYSGSILTTAYRDTNSGAFAIVAINTTGIPLTPTFSLTNFPAVASVVPWLTSPDVSLAVQSSVPVSGGAFSYTLPGLSVVTFVAQTNFPPTFTSIAPQTINPGATLNLTNTASDADLPAQSLTFTLLTAPTNATLTVLNSTNARFTWRPLISQAASTNSIQVKVTDNCTPNLSATNNFVITVNPASQPALSSITVGSSQVSLSATGLIGPDYTLLTSTNLVSWQCFFTTNPAAMPVQFADTNRSDAARFYRLLLGP